MANLSGTFWQVQAFNANGTSVGKVSFWAKPATVRNTRHRQAFYNQQWCVNSNRLMGVWTVIKKNGKSVHVCTVGKL